MKIFRLFVAFTFVCFMLSQRAQGVMPPPPGGYPNFTTAAGDHALQALTSGLGNTGIGTFSLFRVTTGNFNTAVGAGALDLNTGDSNTATGTAALLFNTTGTENTAVGTAALEFNNSGILNTANGVFTLFSNINGGYNTAQGDNALYYNTAGSSNTANGDVALYSNTTGSGNTAVGAQALSSNTTGSYNIALGYAAAGLLTMGDNNIDIGHNAGAGVSGAESNTIRIGNDTITDTYIAGISGATASGGAAVFVNSTGKLGTMTSSARFKQDIQPMGSVSETILALRPVRFRYKKEVDPQGIPQFGLVAEDVERVNPDLVIRDTQGVPQTVRYEQINAMLLNEFLKEHRIVHEQDKKIKALEAEMKEQKALIQKVSAQLEVSKAAPQTVVNNR